APILLLPPGGISFDLRPPMSIMCGFVPMFLTVKCAAQPRRPPVVLKVADRSLTVTRICTLIAGAVVASALGTARAAASAAVATRSKSGFFIPFLPGGRGGYLA